MRALILLCLFILPACIACDDSFRAQLENLIPFSSESSLETPPITKEPISKEALEKAKRSVWEVNNYLIYTENEIHKDQNSTEAFIEQKEQTIHLGHGSGFFINPTQMVTNFHVINNINENTQIIANKMSEDGEIQSHIMTLNKVSALYDLALLSTETPVTDYLNLKWEGIDPNKDSFFLTGYPKGKFITTPLNYQESLWGHKILSFYRDAQLGQLIGASGGPITDQNAEVAGVNYAGTENFIFAVSNFALNDFLREDHSTCLSSSSEEENCIHKELTQLVARAEQGDTFAQYKLKTNNSFRHLFNKRIALQEFITENRNLNHAKVQMIEALNIYTQEPNPENHKQHLTTVEAYQKQIEVYNKVAGKLKQLSN